MIEMQGQLGEVHMTIQVKRAATGQVEEFNLTGKAYLAGEPAEQVKDESHVPDAQHNGA